MTMNQFDRCCQRDYFNQKKKIIINCKPLTRFQKRSNDKINYCRLEQMFSTHFFWSIESERHNE